MNDAVTPGLLDTKKLTAPMRSHLRTVIADSVKAFMSAAGGLKYAYYVIVDSGASKNMTNNPADAIPGSLKKLDTPIEADGIAGGLIVEYDCLVAWETLDTYGNPIKLVTTALVCEALPC